MPETTAPAPASTPQDAEITAALGKRSVVLIGMMGAGKSTIGRRLAARLRLPFLDADIEIEAAAGMSIPDIFETHGEPHFRDGEARVIARLLDNGPAVIATGGGAFMREETRSRIGGKAVSIWLKADADIIMRRVKRRADRPLLQTADPAATIGRLIREREPVYQHADITIWSRDVPHEKIVDECIEGLHALLCVGGKTGINSPQGKNLLGAFHQPVLVVADTAVLDTLSPRQFRAGYAEVAKYGVLGDEAFFAWLETNHADIFKGGAAREHAIATSCRAKAAIVARDERETGERALLNLGHTFGHALEAATGFSDRLFHGEGVAVGMALAAEFSAQLGMIGQADAARVTHHLAEVGLPTHLQDIAGFAQEGLTDADALMALMAQDKKVKRGKLTFILLQAVGRAVIAPDVEPSLVRDFLQRKLTRRA